MGDYAVDLLQSDVGIMSENEVEAYLRGFERCLDTYAIWNDGEQEIGIRPENIKDVAKRLRLEAKRILDDRARDV